MTACTTRRLSLLTIALVAVANATFAFGAGKPVGNFKPDGTSTIVPAGTKPVLLWADAEFTEGPAPNADGDILFSDIGNRILRYSPKTKKVDVYRAPSGKANGLIFDPKGNLLACEGAGPGGERRISITPPGGKPRTLADSFEGKRFNSPNDLAVTADGDVYFTDPRYVGDEPRELDFEAVFLVKSDGTVKLATRDVEKPNGILVSPDQKTVYVADNNGDPLGAHTLLAFDRAADGTLVNKRLLFDFGPRKRGIDGMTLDSQGNIYATGGGGGDDAGIYIFAPDGKALGFIHTPGAPTNCVFGVGEQASRL
jgi:sugar lactone lactonase YvrE